MPGLTIPPLKITATTMSQIENDPRERDGLPPFVRSWNQLYISMIATLVMLIVVFYLIMARFQ